MTRKECLEQAAKCVLQNRQDQYGDVEDCFKKIARLWNAYLPSTIELEPFDVACMMALLKIARIQANPKHGDSWVDLAGYAACGADIAVPEPFRYDKPKTDGDCHQNGNDQPEEPDFKPGDKVQFCQFPHADVWFDGIVERVEGGHCFIRRSNGVEVSAPKRLIRRPCAEGCEKPKFKAGDKVQIRVTLPSVSDRIWVDGTYARYDRGCAFPHAVYNDAGHEENVQEEDIRPAPKKAEGVEELVVSPFDEARMRDSMPGIVPQGGPSDFDAPQTPQELYQHIIDANPATFHTPSYAEEQLDHHSRLQTHKPTGEELAEMAEEVTHE